ncbi:hypothetical protein C7C56_020065 [Massilia glaciei]|uniref:Uncharacterized protein n=1 Tax=Massilia glaciei TaxID=1524097 RepID=A0A2U2HGC5_9BURK|nr:hypothetical protein C7C56_020065 [Massilia glaciei]
MPEAARGRCQTLSGMLLLLLGNIPKSGDRCGCGCWLFEIVDLD